MNIAKRIFDKLYSYKGIQLRSNIIGSSTRGLLGVNPNQVAISGNTNRGATTQLNGSRLMSEYYRIMDELEDYELTELTTLILTAYSDFLNGYFTTTGDLVSFANGKKDPDLDKVNYYLSNLDIRNDIKNHLQEIIYWGSYCSLLTWDSENRVFVKKPLKHEHTVVTIFDDQKPLKHLVLDNHYNLNEVSACSLLRYGSLNLSLVNNIREEEDNIKDSKYLTKKYDYLTSEPLYYRIVAKVKEYLLNEVLISLLGIKDLVQPLLLLMNCDKNTDPTQASNFATNVENLINKYVDISTIFSARFSIYDLMNSVINNIRVLPDYNGAAQGLGTLDMSKLKEKLDQVQTQQDIRKEAIVNALSLTMDFLQGRMTRLDAIRQSDRLNGKVTNIIQTLNQSVLSIACNIYYLITKKELKQEDLKCNLFTKTAIQFANEISNSEVVSQLITSVTSIADSAQNTVRDNKLIEPLRYFKYVKSKLSMVDPEAGDLLTEEKFIQLLETIKQEQNGDSGDSY